VASLEGYNLVVFYYLNVSKILPDKREMAFCGSGLIRMGLLYKPTYIVYICVYIYITVTEQ